MSGVESKGVVMDGGTGIRPVVAVLALAASLAALALAPSARAEAADAQLAMWALDETAGTIAYDDARVPQPDGSVVTHDGVYTRAPPLGVPGAPPQDAG